ncbi:hypothetical protein [Flavivirga algicola]|uniref:Uncharacterized protein n=1 Tax=Flavivirga algicola TaxID=2729136 RepID=A0ABX1RW33_9FLAO|nr:hypothetical protein [Flavivirga algicola]NMH86883.1 hypothetical protein [Flavivirga algicola]
MKKITFLFTLCFAVLQMQAQVVSTVFGSTANEAKAEWTGADFNQFEPETSATDGKIQTKTSSILGVASYTGAYARTLLSTDVISFKIRHIDATASANDITKVIFSYRQNGGGSRIAYFSS